MFWLRGFRESVYGHNSMFGFLCFVGSLHDGILKSKQYKLYSYMIGFIEFLLDTLVDL